MIKRLLLNFHRTSSWREIHKEGINSAIATEKDNDTEINKKLWMTLWWFVDILADLFASIIITGVILIFRDASLIDIIKDYGFFMRIFL